MSSKNPSAFPLAIQAEGSGSSFTEEYHSGMTLRDYFAAKAMAAIITSCPGWTVEQMPRVAFTIADAMLKERERNGN